MKKANQILLILSISLLASCVNSPPAFEDGEIYNTPTENTIENEETDEFSNGLNIAPNQSIYYDFPKQNVFLGDILPADVSEMSIEYTCQDGAQIHLKFKTNDSINAFLSKLSDKEIFYDYRELYGIGGGTVTLNIVDEQGLQYTLKNWAITLSIDVGPFMHEYGTSVSGDTANFLEDQLLEYIDDVIIDVDEEHFLLPAYVETKDYILTGNYTYQYTYQKYHDIKVFDYESLGFELIENGEKLVDLSESDGYHHVFFIKDDVAYQYYYYCD